MSVVGLFDVDRTGWPNLALMKLSAWHKAQGDTVLPLNSGERADKRYASVVFSWNRRKAEEARRIGCVIGGSGIPTHSALPAEVEAMKPDYALYGIDYAWGYLMRGCIWTNETCPECVVPSKEGKAREVATIDDLLNPASTRSRPFVVLLDNEFFWKEQWAIDRMQEFTERGIDWCPSQGLDIRVVTPRLCEALARSPFWNVGHTRDQITFAFDNLAYEARFRRGIELLLAHGIKPRQLQSYILVGGKFTATLEGALRRIEICREYGVDPFVMVYRNEHTGRAVSEWGKHLARWTIRRIYKTTPNFADYWPEARRRAQRCLPMIA